MSRFSTTMGLFRRPAQEAAASGPAPAQMRGLAVEITDPGLLRWEVVWEALKTEPPADEPSTITQELGLHEEREIAGAYNADRWGTEFSGTRHGRHVALRIGVVPSIRGKAFNEVHVAASVSPFRLHADDGRIVADPGASPALQQLLAELAPAPKTWRQLEVEGSADEIVARRPVTAHSQGYVYDLWLVERLADRLGS